jgi:predicted nuclease of predicted toxin-antitoxin system
MRILLDECVPRPLRNELTGHHVRTVRQMGWTGIQNGDLLRLAEEVFDVFLTVDRNLEYQQNLKSTKIAVIVLVAKSNSYQDLRPLMPSVVQTLQEIQSGDLVRIGS